MPSDGNKKARQKPIQSVVGVADHQEYLIDRPKWSVLQVAQQPHNSPKRCLIFGFFRRIVGSDNPLLRQVAFGSDSHMQVEQDVAELHLRAMLTIFEDGPDMMRYVHRAVPH